MGSVGTITFEKYSLPQADRVRNEMEMASGAIPHFLVLGKVAISSTGSNETAEVNRESVWGL